MERTATCSSGEGSTAARSYDLLTNSGLERHLEHLARDELLELARHGLANRVRDVAVDDVCKRRRQLATLGEAIIRHDRSELLHYRYMTVT